MFQETQLSTVLPPAGPSDDAAPVECQQCKNTEQLYHTTKLTLDNELEKKEQMAQEIADKVEQNEKLQEELVKLETKVQVEIRYLDGLNIALILGS